MDVSIIIATKNDSIATLFTAQTLLLAAGELETEVIIVDNGSSLDEITNLEDSLKILNNHRISLYHCEIPGANASRDMGAKLAKGKWLFFPDSHTLVDPYYFPRMIKFAKQHNTPIVCSAYESYGVKDYDFRWGGSLINRDCPFNDDVRATSEKTDSPKICAVTEPFAMIIEKDWFDKLTGGLWTESYKTNGGLVGEVRWLTFGTFLFGKPMWFNPKISAYHIYYQNYLSYSKSIRSYCEPNIVTAYIFCGEELFPKLEKYWGVIPKEMFDLAKKEGEKARQYIQQNQVKNFQDFITMEGI